MYADKEGSISLRQHKTNHFCLPKMLRLKLWCFKHTFFVLLPSPSSYFSLSQYFFSFSLTPSSPPPFLSMKADCPWREIHKGYLTFYSTISNHSCTSWPWQIFQSRWLYTATAVNLVLDFLIRKIILLPGGWSIIMGNE